MAQFAELAEAEAGGEIAAIYGEIRRLHGVPYVSSLYRHLATFPGVLEWTWARLGPALADGRIQATAAGIARDHGERPLAPLDGPAAARLGLDDAALAAIRAVCDSFTRVAPSNLLAAGCLRALLDGQTAPAGLRAIAAPPGWRPPAPLPPLPALAPVPHPEPGIDRLLQGLAAGEGAQRFVPGLYRMLAHWPGYLARVGETLGPLLADPELGARGEALAARVTGAAPGILAGLPPAGAPPGSVRPHRAALLAAIATYRRTSPQMLVFSQLLRAALPAGADGGAG